MSTRKIVQVPEEYWRKLVSLAEYLTQEHNERFLNDLDAEELLREVNKCIYHSKVIEVVE